MNAPLPNLIERLLGVEPAGAGEGTAWSLQNSWSWPPWLTLLFIAGTVAFVTWIYAHERGEAGRWYRSLLAGIRLALFGIVLFMLAQFVLSLERTGLPYVVVVVDDSASMGIADRYEDERLRAKLTDLISRVGLQELTRINLAKGLLLQDDAEFLRSISRDYKLKVYFLANSARPQSSELDQAVREIRGLAAQGDSTQLGRGIRAVLNDLLGSPPAAIILLSDGTTTAGEPLSAITGFARGKGVPLFTVAIGDEQPPRDLEISDLLVDEVAFVDDIVNFEFQLSASGLAGQPVEIVLKEQNAKDPVARMTVQAPPAGQIEKLRLPYRPREVGEFEFTLEATPLAEEVSADNNRQSRAVSVRKEQIRVLLVQSYPNYEFRYLKHMLERDSTIELKTLLQEADPEYASQDKSAI
ncbi:MAG: VWA domain-containing protein, partial [Planctomycetaceae bacterium]|nr:VWA domain-containing protein [Planctomycetaceae bacterium]